MKKNELIIENGKKYVAPEAKVYVVEVENHLLEGSGGSDPEQDI